MNKVNQNEKIINMKKRNLVPQITTPVDRSSTATSKTQAGVSASWATNDKFLGGFARPIYDFAAPFAGDDAE